MIVYLSFGAYTHLPQPVVLKCHLTYILFLNCIIAGVNLWKLEQRPNVGSMLLKLDFNEDVAPRLLFLKEIGVDEAHFGNIITHNPFILTESVENLKARWQEHV